MWGRRDPLPPHFPSPPPCRPPGARRLPILSLYCRDLADPVLSVGVDSVCDWGARLRLLAVCRLLGRWPMSRTQPSLWSAAPQSLLPCPGNCAALQYAERCALASAHRSRRAGAETDAPCPHSRKLGPGVYACGGRAVAVVSRLAPLTIRSRGGIPYRPPWMPWEEHAAWRQGQLQKRVIGADWRRFRRRIRRCRFLPGWRIDPDWAGFTEALGTSEAG